MNGIHDLGGMNGFGSVEIEHCDRRRSYTVLGQVRGPGLAPLGMTGDMI
jgi:hypothetical protein